MGREPQLAPTPDAHRWAFLADFIAGGLAGLCCDALLHPLDTVKSRLHVQRGPPFKYRSMFHALTLISRHEGRKGLYAGFAAVLAGSAPSHAFMFAAYKAFKRLGEQAVPDATATQHSNPPSTLAAAHVPTVPGPLIPVETQLAAVDLTSGAVGEIFALPFYVPAEVIAKRMQVATLGPARNYESVSHAARCIFRTEGPTGLMTGFWPTMMRDVPYTALQFSLFTAFKDRYRQFVARPNLNDAEATALGAAVGAVSAAITNPLDVVKTRFMTQATGSERKYHTILQCMRRMVAEEGVLSLTRGMLPRILWVAPGSGITLAVYERVATHLKTRWTVEEPNNSFR